VFQEQVREAVVLNSYEVDEVSIDKVFPISAKACYCKFSSMGFEIKASWLLDR
jgi:hypothetical protein